MIARRNFRASNCNPAHLGRRPADDWGVSAPPPVPSLAARILGAVALGCFLLVAIVAAETLRRLLPLDDAFDRDCL